MTRGSAAERGAAAVAATGWGERTSCVDGVDGGSDRLVGLVGAGALILVLLVPESAPVVRRVALWVVALEEPALRIDPAKQTRRVDFKQCHTTSMARVASRERRWVGVAAAAPAVQRQPACQCDSWFPDPPYPGSGQAPGNPLLAVLARERQQIIIIDLAIAALQWNKRARAGLACRLCAFLSLLPPSSLAAHRSVCAQPRGGAPRSGASWRPHGPRARRSG